MAALGGTTAVVTGASRGLGYAIAAALLGEGARTALLARNPEGLERAGRELGAPPGQMLLVPCDVSDPRAVERAAAQVLDAWDAVDVLVNNAGIPAPTSMEETGTADWQAVVGTNLSGAFYVTRAFWPALVASGRGYVINISGSAGLRGGPSPAYGAAKFGLTGLTRAIAANGRPHGLRATVLYPGGMDTGWRGRPRGRPPAEAMDPGAVARMVVELLTRPPELVVHEVVLGPIGEPWV